MSDLLKAANLTCAVESRRLSPMRRLGMVLLACAVAALVALALSVASPDRAYAYDPNVKPVEVDTVEKLLTEIKASREKNYSGNIVLTKDIVFEKNDPWIDQIIQKHGSLTFGSKEHPFEGGFDGNGHYIIGLDYRRDLWVPAANTGLFSFTDGAYLHDINFRDCYIGADFRAGVLVGQATATRIESVRMENCTLSVTPANNSVSLITNAGIMGGMIAGEMHRSSMYNCTVQGGRVVNNSVVAVSGLGGEGLYLGAMVGSAENSVIEYCRVLPTTQYYKDRVDNPSLDPFKYESGKYPYLTEVYNRYEVAVGAVAGQGVYVGGVLGFANDVDVVDCFSTAWAHTWVANYVGVGSGNIGYVGGIIAHAKSSQEGANLSQIIRCHFAGNMESYQWNSLAIIPIIQSNVYLAGLLERDWEEDTGLYNSYFKRNLINGMEDKIKPYPEGYVRTCGDWLGLDYSGSQSVSGYSYGPIVDDDQYKSRSFWEGEGYDFAGNIERRQTQNTDDPIAADDLINSGTHINKWIIDEKLGIPVHGDSVKATLDFPGAGSVEISPSSIDGTKQVTTDPYNFAVQGVSATETELTFTTAVDNKASNPALSKVSHEKNGGFRFQGWYRAPSITANHIQQGSHKFFDPLVPPEPNAGQVSADLKYTAINHGTGSTEKAQFVNNDLFVAYCQAQVLFHDVTGGVISKADSSTETTPNVDDDWYNHQDKLPKVAEPKNRQGVDGTAKFLGWTTRKNGTSGGGWPSALSTEISDMKAHGEFFEGGELIEKPMDLYPVYADLVGQNVKIIFEGHELDNEPQTNVRAGVGSASITLVDGSYQLSVTGVEQDGKLPDGYRFLGWYKVNVNEKGDPSKTEVPGVRVGNAADTTTAYRYDLGLRVSQTPEYKIPDSDLTAPVYYYARFEYRVDYYAKEPANNKPNEWQDEQLFSHGWKSYLSSFDDITGPHFHTHKTDHWSLNGLDSCDGADNATEALAKGIASPQRVNAHVSKIDDSTLHNITLFYDFPNSATLSGTKDGGVLGYTVSADYDKSSFDFKGWSWMRDDRQGIKEDNPWKAGWHQDTLIDYWYEAHLVAHVRFMDTDPQDNPLVDVTRAYSDTENDTATGAVSNQAYSFVNGYQKVFMGEDVNYGFRYAKRAANSESEKPCGLTTTSEKSPSDVEMQDKRPGSYFVGWIDQSAIANGTMTQAEYDAVYDQNTRTAKSLQAVLPYIVPDNALCERPMTLYPVYADFRVVSTTNITRGTNLTDPANPTFDVATPSMGNGGVKSVTFSADVDAATTANYDLVSWTIESPGGTVVDTITQVGNAPVSNANASLTYNINPGQPYVVVANYEAKAAASLSVTYHVSADDPKTMVYTKTYGDVLGKGPQPQFMGADLDSAIFAGWTETMPATGDYHIDTDNLTLASENDVVYKSMELWPVYRAIKVTVNSNIDNTDSVTTDHRGVKVVDVKTGQQLDQDGKPVMVDGKPVYTYKKAAQLWATDVDGYAFEGWYLNYVSDTQRGTLVSAERDHLLSDEAVFAGNTYTAVYKKVDSQTSYEIRFHIPEGKSDGTEDVRTVVVKDKGVSIVQEVPKYDEDGKLTEDKILAQVYGIEETQALLTLLENKSNAPGAMVYEQFKEWQWLKPGVDGKGAEVIKWSGFCQVDFMRSDATATDIKTIQEQCPDGMDLYPATYQFKAKEWKKTPATDGTSSGEFVDYAPSNLAWYMNPAATGDEQAVKVAFKPGVLYLSDKLAINMSEAAYAPLAGSTAPTVTGTPGKNIGLYADFTDVSGKDATPLNVQTTAVKDGSPEPGNVIGDAVFQFENKGSLVIEKTAPAEADNGTFAFTVTECAADGTAIANAKSATVYVTVNKTTDGSAAKGLVRLDVPWGYYHVAENGWGWQYNPTCKLLMNGFENQNLPEGVILIKSTNNQAQVTNTHNGEGFKDGEARTKNEFGQGVSGSQPTTRSARIANPTAEGGN